MPQVRQIFERIGSSGLSSGDGSSGRSPADARFEHFRTVVWPRLQSGAATGAAKLAGSADTKVQCNNHVAAGAEQLLQDMEDQTII